MNPHAVILALVSAALFGVSTPAAKMLLGAIDPIVLAGLLYGTFRARARAVKPCRRHARHPPMTPWSRLDASVQN